jgi:hypothetical protein
MRRKTAEERYELKLNKQRKQLEDFAEHETEWAETLMTFYRLKKADIPDDEYRGCAFFLNKEYSRKPGSLVLLYFVYERCYRELPEVTKETAFDILRFRYRMYAGALEKGGY